MNGATRAPHAVSVSVGSAAGDAIAVPRTVGLNSFSGVVLERSRTYTRVRASLEPISSSIASRIGHEHRLEELGDAARAVRGQSKGRAAQTDYHGEEDAQQVGRTQVGRTELAEAQAEAGARRGRLRLLHGALNVRTRVRHEQCALHGQGSTHRGRRRRRRGVVDERVAGADASEVFLVDVRSEQGREAVGVDAADRGEALGGHLGAVDQVGLALALDLAERGGGPPLVDALRVTYGRREVTGSRSQDQ